MFEKIKNYIKNNKLYITVMILGTFALMIQMKYVVLYADDLFLGVISKNGLRAAIEHMIENYFNWGGGPTPLIAIIFLMFRIGIWKIFNCIMIVITIILAVRMITYNNKINKGIIAACIWMLIYVLNIFISAETMYWLDGNLAYVLTAFQMFIYFYYLYSRIIMKTNSKKYDYILLPLLGFFAGWSGPQAGALTVIIPIVLFVWAKFINKEKIKKAYIISWIIALIGFLIYFLAPGNSVRSQESFPEFTSYNIIEKILYRMDSVWNLIFNFKIYYFASIPFYLYIALGFMSVITMKISKQDKNNKIARFISILSIFLIIFMSLNLAIGINCNLFDKTSDYIFNFKPLLENIKNNTFSIIMLIPYAITSLVFVAGIILSYYISYKEKTPLIFIIFCSSILGQLMMLISPYSPLRTTFITVMLLWITIAYLISIILREKISVIGIISLVLAMTYDVKIVFIMLLIYFIFKNNEVIVNNSKKLELILISVFFAIISCHTYFVTLYGYHANWIVYNENIRRIEEFKNNNTQDNVLYLKEATYPLYGFTGFVGTDWIEESVKKYFEIDSNVVLKYQEEEY